MREPSGDELDLLTWDGGVGSLLTAYLMAERGHRVGIVEQPPAAGTVTVDVVACRRIAPLRSVVESAPVITRRGAYVLQPEGSLWVGHASERLGDLGSAVAVVERGTVVRALAAALREAGGVEVAPGGGLMIDHGGFVVGYREPGGIEIGGRCSLLAPADVEALMGIPDRLQALPEALLETEWVYRIAPRSLRTRFGLTASQAAEWWLYGDVFDGYEGFARLRAWGEWIALGVVVPLRSVRAEGLVVEALGARLVAHPLLVSALANASLESVTGRTVMSGTPSRAQTVGDGWVAGPVAAGNDPTPLSTEIAMAEATADVLAEALGARRVSAARLSTLPARLGHIGSGRVTMAVSLGPIHAWADEAVISPTSLIDGLRALADRFASAG